MLFFYKSGERVVCPTCGSENISPLYTGDEDNPQPTDAICEDCETLI